MGITESSGALHMSLAILCDFDGTVLNIDTCVFILEKFAEGDWRTFDEQLEKGEITLEECLRKQFSTVRVSKKLILKEIEPVLSVRPNFEKLVEYCSTYKIALILVSAGLDFVIRHFLEQRGWGGFMEVYAPKATCTVKGIKFTFPKLFDEASISFKDDLVRRCKREGNNVVYVGDGFADYHAARNADLAFAIKGSKSAELLKREGIVHKEISDFQDVVEAMRFLLL